MINKGNYVSIFGDSVMESSYADSMLFKDNVTSISHSSSKKDADSELAAKTAEMESMKLVHNKRRNWGKCRLQCMSSLQRRDSDCNK